MLKQEQIERIQPTIRIIKLIGFALIIGAITPVLLFCALVDWNNVHSNFDGILVLFGVGLACLAIVMAVFIPSIVSNSMASAIAAEDDSGVMKLVTVFQTKTIIRFALLEGAAFLNVIIFFIEHSLISLGLAVFLIAIMAGSMPRTDAIYSWIEDRLG